MPRDMLSHPDPRGGPGTVLFDEVAIQGGAVPAWNRESGTCAATYCHGSTLPEAETRAVPVWTRVDGSQALCTSCHGFPPGGAHPASPVCEACHGAVIATGGVIIAPELHVNGTVEFGAAALGVGHEGSAPDTQLAAPLGEPIHRP